MKISVVVAVYHNEGAISVTHQKISAAVLAERCVSGQRPSVRTNLESCK